MVLMNKTRLKEKKSLKIHFFLDLGKIYLTKIGEDYKLRFGISGKGSGPIRGTL